MQFTILAYRQVVPNEMRSQAFLTQDDWNDYSYYALYYLSYVDDQGLRTQLGAVKIAYFGQEKGAEARKLLIGNTFQRLEDQYFSLGQDDSYYSNLNSLGENIRDEILEALHDIAKDDQLYEKAILEEVAKQSLLRSVSPTSVAGQFRRLTLGGARLSKYDFDFSLPIEEMNPNQVVLSFSVVPESTPPTDIHVIIGRNGVGKTHLINNMINTLVKTEESPLHGVFKPDENTPLEKLFANLISVSFSAFDIAEPLDENMDQTNRIHYSYIGLKQKKTDKKKALTLKSPEMLSEEFVSSAQKCKKGSKADLWIMALKSLASDPIFRDADIPSIINLREDNEFEERCGKSYGSLSSGHKIILYTITRLVERIEERSLVLMDEPETHLHPPLLSAFTRALSNLLVHKNGVAIIATHSPVILQEVPKSCVYTLRKSGHDTIAERLDAETFGENVGSLTREVFGLEVTDSGFHKAIIDLIDKGNNYDSIVQLYAGQLGMEARAILRARIASRDGLINNQ